MEAPDTTTKDNIITDMFKQLVSSLSFIICPIQYLFTKIWSFTCWLYSNPYRSLMLFILLVFFICFYYFRALYGLSPFLKKYSSYTTGFFVILGTLLVIGVFGLFSGAKGEVNIKEQPEGYPTNGALLLKYRWSLYNALCYYRGLGIITGVLLAIALIISLIGHSTVILYPVAMLVMVCAFGVLIYKKYHTLPPIIQTALNEPLWLKIATFFYTSFHSVIGKFTGILESFTNTNMYIKILLLIEIVGIFLYLVVPIAKKYIYTHVVTKKDDLSDTQADMGADMATIESEKELSSLMGGLTVDWDNIFSKGLYKKSKESELTEYLEKNGFLPKQGKQHNLVSKIIGIPINIETAITYVQANAGPIIELKNSIAHMKSDKHETKENKNKNDNIGKTKILLDDPIYTDSEKTIATYKDIGNSLGTFNYNYSISAWFFIHNESPSVRFANTKFTSLLNYGGRPNLLFNVETNTLRVTVKNSLDKENMVYETDKIRLQRWNNIITNVNSGKLDIFINGKLVSSTTISIPFMSYDTISTGEDNGISGGVCNVTYYPKPLNLPEIILLYKSLKWGNPPII